MKNHWNILPKLASFDLKCSKMRWLGQLTTLPRPPNRKRQRAFGARHSSFRVHFYISIPLPGPSLTEFLDPPLVDGRLIGDMSSLSCVMTGQNGTFYPYHFVRTLLAIPFCPIPFCPRTSRVIVMSARCQHFHFLCLPGRDFGLQTAPRVHKCG